MKKVLTYVVKKQQIVPASFTDKIVDLLQEQACQEHEAQVSFTLSNNCLILSPCNEKNSYVLRRAAHCPFVQMTENDLIRLPAQTKSRGVDVAVSTLVQSADKYVLLTRRAAHMRTFPRVWVPPGGHIDLNESIKDAGLRELHEETGISVQTCNSNVEILCLWESAFPPSLLWGTLPSRHHVLLYTFVEDKRTAEEITKTIKLQADEVDQCAWVCPHLAFHLISSDSQFINVFDPPSAACDEVNCTKVFSSPAEAKSLGAVLIDGSTIRRSIEVAPMLNPFSLEQKDRERISTGTKFALKMWLETAFS